jgi:predicted metal-dependent TIM-barrel fold hydrolase
LATLFGAICTVNAKGAKKMNGSAQQLRHDNAIISAFARNARASFMGSKLIQAMGLEPGRLDAVHHAMMLRLIDENSAISTAKDEAEQLAAHIVAVARVADQASASGDSKAAMAAVMRESGRSIDPMIAQNFLRLASSPIFWMALDSVGEARVS